MNDEYGIILSLKVSIIKSQENHDLSFMYFSDRNLRTSKTNKNGKTKYHIM